MPVKLTLSKAIRYHRKRLGFTQEAAAKAAGVKVLTWKVLESGRANPRLSTLEAVAFTLHIPVSALFGLYWADNNVQPLIDNTENPES